MEFSGKQEQPVKRHRTCLHVPTTVRWRPERLESCEGEADVSPGPVEPSLPFPFSLGGKEESSTIHSVTPEVRGSTGGRGASVWSSRPWLVKVSSQDEKVWQSSNRVPQGQCV